MALAYEIEEIGKALTRIGLSPATLYIGGGTPTVLTVSQLRDLLNRISHSFPLGELLEYTVEAGRPDTLDREKLKLLRDYGVTRVSVNPQTFNPAPWRGSDGSIPLNSWKQRWLWYVLWTFPV